MLVKDLKVAELKKVIQETDTLDCLVRLSYEMEQDRRESVKKLVDSVDRKIEKINNFRWKFCEMQAYEKRLKINGCHVIAGLDEAGRGPLAGPVVAAAVVLGDEFDVLGIDDSKKLSETQRETLYKEIISHSQAYGIGTASVEEIDELNILNATKLAMKRAIINLGVKPDHLLIDALELDGINAGQTAIIKGDQKSLSIAAASILAKVTRDKMVVEISKTYPMYGFEHHKGYGTKEHCQAILQYGPTELHRKAFIRNLMAGEKHEGNK